MSDSPKVPDMQGRYTFCVLMILIDRKQAVSPENPSLGSPKETNNVPKAE